MAPGRRTSALLALLALAAWFPSPLRAERLAFLPDVGLLLAPGGESLSLLHDTASERDHWVAARPSGGIILRAIPGGETSPLGELAVNDVTAILTLPEKSFDLVIALRGGGVARLDRDGSLTYLSELLATVVRAADFDGDGVETVAVSVPGRGIALVDPRDGSVRFLSATPAVDLLPADVMPEAGLELLVLTPRGELAILAPRTGETLGVAAVDALALGHGDVDRDGVRDVLVLTRGHELLALDPETGVTRRFGLSRRDSGWSHPFLLLALAEPSVIELPFVRADVNVDQAIDIGDALAILLELFAGQPAAAPCPDARDANDDGEVDVSDVVSLVKYLFLRGEAPPPPFPGPGLDPTADSIQDCLVVETE